MRKFILLILTIFILCTSAFAKNTPLYKDSINVEGIGIIRLPNEFNVYEKANLKSKIVAKYKWGKSESAIIRDTDYGDNFVIFNPLENIAFMSVVEADEGNNWYKVCYDQKKKYTGWVKPERYEFYTWATFFQKYGKENGLYLFRGLPANERILYSKDDTNSRILKRFERIKTIRVQMYKGDWVLVKMYDYENKIMIGWFKWRTDDGKFRIFPIVK